MGGVVQKLSDGLKYAHLQQRNTSFYDYDYYY